MSFISVLISVALTISAYVGGSILTAEVMMKKGHVERYNDKEPTVFALIAGAFWPVSLPLVLTMYVPDAFRFIKKSLPTKHREAKGSEIIPGVERPSRILAQMIAARILQSYNNIKYDNWSDKTVKVSWHKVGNTYMLTRITVNHNSAPIDDRDHNIIIDYIAFTFD